jgi:DNA-binding MarR family transcriptional regulator
MRALNFSGREASVLRAIDFALGTLGADIVLRCRMDPQDALDILNGLLDIGYIETSPVQQTHVQRWNFSTTMFEVNPAFAHELKKALVRR